jgi:hypothetical protein
VSIPAVIASMLPLVDSIPCSDARLHRLGCPFREKAQPRWGRI